MRYTVRDLTTSKSREVLAAPNDTTILSLAPGNYVVLADSLPSRCVIPRGGNQQGITLLETDNTGIVRWSIECRTLVSIAVLTDGFDVDREFVYRVRPLNGAEVTGIVAANDTVSFDNLATGDYVIDIGGVAENCTVTNDGGFRQRISVEGTGGAAVVFRVICSDPAKRPRVFDFLSGYDLGASVFTFKVYDPDHDIIGYYLDITDCNGNSVLPLQRERVRRGLRGGRGQSYDTLTVVGAFEFGLTPEEMRGKCTELRVFDNATNQSTIVVHKIGSGGGSAPFVRFFNSYLIDQSYIASTIEASDPDNDIVGHFVLVRTRDGVLGPPDGNPDLGSMDAAGYIGLDIPLIPTTGRLKWDDVYSVIVYVIDSRGNVTRVQDDDLLR
ncbi:MAG: hypothetical protein H7099_15595 [Gemmatimonadaceae bacterium]|nr:hypothetical protein [Gemmatimonadaceae bacterium]